MANPLYRQHFISINDLSTAQLEFLLALALQLKQQPQADLLDGRLIGSCFLNRLHEPVCHLKLLSSGWAVKLLVLLMVPIPVPRREKRLLILPELSVIMQMQL